MAVWRPPDKGTQLTGPNNANSGILELLMVQIAVSGIKSGNRSKTLACSNAQHSSTCLNPRSPVRRTAEAFPVQIHGVH
jgi:hypothetical protein